MSKTSEKSRTAIVVGGSSGIGCETVFRLTEGGWQVFNISRTPCINIKVNNICADVTEEDAFKNIGLIAEEYGLSLLVYCAGCSMAAPIEYAREGDYRYLFEVNYFGALRAVQTAVPFMKKGGGRVEYDREKLRSSMLIALRKRPVSPDRLDEAVDRIEQKMMLSGEREIRSSRVGELVLEALRDLDTIAYIRFASVYFNINDPEAFAEMIERAARDRADRRKAAEGDVFSVKDDEAVE